MSEDIKTCDMTARAKFGADYIYEDQALPSSTNMTSEIFQFGSVQSSLGLIVEASGDIDIASTYTLKIELLYDVSETGDFANSVTILDFTAAANTSIQVTGTLADEVLSGVDETISQSLVYTIASASSAVVGSTKTWTIVGQDLTTYLTAGDSIVVAGTVSNNGTFTIVTATEGGGDTTIVVSETCTNETFTGPVGTITVTAWDLNTVATSLIEKDSSLIVWKTQDITDFVVVPGSVTLANTASNDGTYPLVSVLLGDVYVDGQEIVNMVPSDVIKQFCKIKVTTTSDLSSYAITAYTYPIPR